MVAERDGHANKELRLVLSKTLKTCRVAEEGETPTHWIDTGLGTPASPELYEGVLWGITSTITYYLHFLYIIPVLLLFLSLSGTVDNVV